MLNGPEACLQQEMIPTAAYILTILSDQSERTGTLSSSEAGFRR